MLNSRLRQTDVRRSLGNTSTRLPNNTIDSMRITKRQLEETGRQGVFSLAASNNLTKT